MNLHDIGLTTVAFFSEFVGTISGFGSSTFFVPTALFFEKFHLVLAMTSILHLFGNSFRLILFRKDFAWPIFLKLFLPSVLFTALGAALTSVLPGEILQKALGILLILIAPQIILKKKWKLPPWAIYALTSLSGFSTGLVGTGGAIRGLALSALALEKNAFVAISAGIDFGGDFLRAGIYLKNGYMGTGHWFYIPLLGIAAYLGSRLGQIFLRRINQLQFDRLVFGFVFVSGIFMIFRSGDTP